MFYSKIIFFDLGCFVKISQIWSNIDYIYYALFTLTFHFYNMCTFNVFIFNTVLQIYSKIGKKTYHLSIWERSRTNDFANVQHPRAERSVVCNLHSPRPVASDSHWERQNPIASNWNVLVVCRWPGRIERTTRRPKGQTKSTSFFQKYFWLF